ncbi:hypothetical protein PFAG_04837 [Plasmodium falciparum Santa Lucia]|uniref:Uncharacterized protein n=5 Tax=Plasmodium falciparum TaxID=5833 RepID=W4J085_PLAFP|nr:hypothetical protein PFNF135_04948 [Plasmodium falciparum NF135/5.C10]ETW55645.1 hypothetical protein PFUGPA_02410 [Plasmodium falciparum Palo Alto/Uganda]ETW59254.1 hypothetical protein PFMC_04733 [Plasmodium falciparum CAMP/Malaysia]EUT80193.1 hypothetical protein PFAG_04837 [Plasmodium falciparum Santa Lucia]KOB61270.1 hypothetical protein PFHG_03019 [Plasmodium falciparum HB3]
MKFIFLYLLILYKIILSYCYLLKRNKVLYGHINPSSCIFFIVQHNSLKNIAYNNNNNNNNFVYKKKKFSNNRNKKLCDSNDDEKKQPFINNSNIFRNKYNYIPTFDEVKKDIEIFKKDYPYYFTEHSILELIRIENNIVVINIEGQFFEDINVVFSEVTKYLLNKYMGILGVHPYNIRNLNIRGNEM